MKRIERADMVEKIAVAIEGITIQEPDNTGTKTLEFVIRKQKTVLSNQ